MRRPTGRGRTHWVAALASVAQAVAVDGANEENAKEIRRAVERMKAEADASAQGALQKAAAVAQATVLWNNAGAAVAAARQGIARVGREQHGAEHNLFHCPMAHHATEQIDFAVWEAMVEADQQLCCLGSLPVLEEAGDLHAGNVKPWSLTNSTCVGVYFTTSVCV